MKQAALDRGGAGLPEGNARRESPPGGSDAPTYAEWWFCSSLLIVIPALRRIHFMLFAFRFLHLIPTRGREPRARVRNGRGGYIRRRQELPRPGAMTSGRRAKDKGENGFRRKAGMTASAILSDMRNPGAKPLRKIPAKRASPSHMPLRARREIHNPADLHFILLVKFTKS